VYIEIDVGDAREPIWKKLSELVPDVASCQKTSHLQKYIFCHYFFLQFT